MPEFDMTPYMPPPAVQAPPPTAEASNTAPHAKQAWQDTATNTQAAVGALNGTDDLPQYMLAVDDWEEAARRSSEIFSVPLDGMLASRRESEYLDIPAAELVPRPAASDAAHHEPAPPIGETEVPFAGIAGFSNGDWDEFNVPVSDADFYANSTHADLALPPPAVASVAVADSKIAPQQYDLDMVPERQDGYLQIAGDEALQRKLLTTTEPPTLPASSATNDDMSAVENGFAFEQFGGFGDAAQGQTDFGVVESYLRSLDDERR